MKRRFLILENPVGSRKTAECGMHKLRFLRPWRSSAQPVDAPRKSENALIASKVAGNRSCIPYIHKGCNFPEIWLSAKRGLGFGVKQFRLASGSK